MTATEQHASQNQPDRSNLKSWLAEQPWFSMDRRTFVKGGFKSILALFLGRNAYVAGLNKEQIQDEATFLTQREQLNKKESFLPKNPLEIHPREASDALFGILDLENKYPTTLNKDSFHALLQRPSRLSALFYGYHSREQDQGEFIEYTKQFFLKMAEYAELFEIDLPAVLLLFQISGDATNSARAFNGDVTQERIRVGLSLSRHFFKKSPQLAVDALRATGIGPYYGLARLEGPVTVGIHDIEIIMITRGLMNLKQTLPDKWQQVMNELTRHAPEFSNLFESYADTYDEYEQTAESTRDELENNPVIANYIAAFHSREFLQKMLFRGKHADTYQFSRTTLTWAIVSELDQIYNLKVYSLKRSDLEKQAVNMAIDAYLAEPTATHFFLDHLLNPRLLRFIALEAEEGVPGAAETLALCKELDQKSERVLTQDREIAASLSGSLEFDLDFQMLTGVAYIRWILNEAQGYRAQSRRATDLHYTNPHELAFDCFSALGLRETAANYLQTGYAPLSRATLPFAPPDRAFGSLTDFNQEVYAQFESVPPHQDFQTYLQYFLYMIEESIIQPLANTSRSKIFGDQTMTDFITAAQNYGAYKTILTQPHCAWLRAVEATMAYTGELLAQHGQNRPD